MLAFPLVRTVPSTRKSTKACRVVRAVIVKVAVQMEWSTKVRNIHKTDIRERSCSLDVEVDKFAGDAGVPSGADGAINSEVDKEANKFL